MKNERQTLGVNQNWICRWVLFMTSIKFPAVEQKNGLVWDLQTASTGRNDALNPLVLLSMA